VSCSGKRQGIGIIYISHRLSEVFSIADRVMVMRDGAHVATRKIADVDRDALIEMMETVRLLFGADRRDRGSIELDGVALRLAHPRDARLALERASREGRVDVVACSPAAAQWPLMADLGATIPALSKTRVLAPTSYYWPNFLKADNLLNVANQIVVIAVVAIGMTMVIITAGIDLSVGSLIALSAVAAGWMIREFAGAADAGTLGMILCCLAGIGLCAAMGLFSGGMVALFRVPPFIVTLGMMLVGSGLAYTLAGGESIYQVPESFIWLGRGTAVWKVPNSVVLMVLLFAAAHVVMSKTVLGRYIYAIGGNAEAARLSGVPVRRVVLLVYTLSGALAGLGGIITASQLKNGSPTYGLMYETCVNLLVDGKVVRTAIEPFGSKINRTPNLNRMAAEGMKLSSFYVAAAVCTPSRAALMTGCYPKRVGLAMGSWHSVLMPGDSHGLHPDEITVAELLRSAGYATGCFGKWHLGDQPEFLPTRHGFDTYFGIPYSNDMWAGDARGFPPLRGGKGSQFEGGMREPTLAWWPGTVPAGSVCDELLTSMDVLPTFAALAGAKVPDGRVIDGRDILPLLKGQPGAKTPHEMFFYYGQNNLKAVRAGKWKLFANGELYDLEADIGESRNVAGQNPGVVARLRELLERAREDLGDGGRPGKNCRPVGVSANPRTLLPRAGVSGDAAYAPYRWGGETPGKKDAKAGKRK
jgi:ribose/xylose/arabinose/galactoside ABC-type transport system permease subunit